MATIEGVVLYPPRFGITVGTPSSTMATHEFVVPKSIPITRSMGLLGFGRAKALPLLNAARPHVRAGCASRSLYRLRSGMKTLACVLVGGLAAREARPDRRKP